jgi:hypothetical protein
MANLLKGFRARRLYPIFPWAKTQIQEWPANPSASRFRSVPFRAFRVFRGYLLLFIFFFLVLPVLWLKGFGTQNTEIETE